MNKERQRRLALILVIVAAALGLRLVGLTREAFHIDEIYSSQFSAGKTQKILRLNAKDVHPPLYSLLLAKWRAAFGDSRWDHRSYSVLWSILGLGALGLLARDLTIGKATPVLVMAFGAVHPLDVFYAQEARMYAQLAALVTLSSWLLWRWISTGVRSDHSRCWAGWAAGYLATAVAVLYTHYLGVTVLLAQGVFASVYFVSNRRWGSVFGYLGCAMASAAAFLPWFNYVRSFRGELYSAEHLRWIPEPGFTDAAGIFNRELLWGNAPLPAPWSLIFRVLSIGIVIVIACLIVRYLTASAPPAGGDRREVPWLQIAYPAWLLFGPIILAVAVSHLYHPVFYPPRFSILVLAPFLVLTGQALERHNRTRTKWLAAVALGMLMASATVVQTSVVSRRGMYEFASLWDSAGPPSAAVFFPAFKAKEASHYVGSKIRSARRPRIEEIVESGVPSVIWVCVHRGHGRGSQNVDEPYLRWLVGLGPVEKIATADNLDVFVVSVATRDAPPPKITRE
jgi:uncharacterized membrane protein